MNIFSKIKSLFVRKTAKPTVNTFLQLASIYSGLMHLNLSVINKVNYPILYKDMADYKFTLDGVQYSVHMKELFNYGLDYVKGESICRAESEITPEQYNSSINSSSTAPLQQYNISVWNRNVSINLMAGIDGQTKLNSNVQSSTVKAILSALQETVDDALQVCDKYVNTKRVPIIVDEKVEVTIDEHAVSAGKELESLYNSQRKA
jgi:hypothetical protein